MVSFDFDFCYLSLDADGFVVVRDIWDGLEIATLDTIEEALEFLSRG